MVFAGNNRTKLGLLADQAVVSGSTLATQLLIAGSLGIEAYGRFSAVVLVQLFLLSLQQAAVTGMYQVVYPRLEARQAAAYSGGIMAAELYVLGALFLLGALLFPFYHFGFGAVACVFILLNVVLMLAQDFFRRIFLARDRVKDALIADVLNNGLQLAGLLVLAVWDNHSFVWVLGVCALSFVPAIAWAWHRLKLRAAGRYLNIVHREHGREAAWMTGAALLQWFAGNFFIIAAGWWLGAAMLGILRLGQYVFGVFNLVLQAVENYILARAGASVSDPKNTLLYLRRVQGKMLAVAGVLLVLIGLAVRPVIRIWDIEYPQEIQAVIYGLSIVYLFVVAGYPVRVALRVLKMSNSFFTGYVLNAVFGFATAYVFIHYWQLNGVLAGLLLSQALLLSYWLLMLQRKYNVLWK